MTYEQALQIAIEQLDDAVDYLKAMNKGFPKVEKQVDEFRSASNALRKALEEDNSFETIRCQVDYIIEMLESEDYSREDVANYAKHLLTDINSMIEDKNT